MKNKIGIASFALLLFAIGSVGASPAKAANTPEQTTKIFYEWYLKDLKREGGNPIDNKTMLAKYATKRLIKQINAWRDAEEYDVDYFIDAQDFDDKWRVTVSKAVVKGNTAKLKVVLAAPKAKATDWKQNLSLELIKENGAWKIDEVSGLNYGA